MSEEPDDALREEIESSFDPMDFAEVEIRVRLPGECTSDGLGTKFNYRQFISPDDIRIAEEAVPSEIRRITNLLIMSLRFR